MCGSSQPPQAGPEGPYWLKGRVVEEGSHQPVAGLTVITMSEKETRTDEKGEFHLRGLAGPEVEDVLGIWGKGYKVIVKEKVPVNTFVEVEIPRSGTIRGKVVDSKTQEPIQSFSVKKLWLPKEDESWLRIFSLDGTFELEDFYPDKDDSPS
ncbi:MAG TPA: hypothetical protein PLA90_18715 [Candidatus Sumerlaeota bacterium]|nr:hypothetical protein [Candidatus Sumerlaeota bacterium]